MRCSLEHRRRRERHERRAPEQLQFAARVAAVSRQHYRRLVHGDADFYAWFQAVTPIDVIARMQIGSRPGGAAGQGRLRCAARRALGVRVDPVAPHAAGLVRRRRRTQDRHRRARPRRSRARPTRTGPSSRTLIDDLEASLARADLDIAAAYEELAEPRLQPFARARARGIRAGARAGAGDQADWARCWTARPTLQRAIELRNPYVDPINLLQVDLLRRWRETGRQDRELFEALLACTAGIAEGLQSTG